MNHPADSSNKPPVTQHVSQHEAQDNPREAPVEPPPVTQSGTGLLAVLQSVGAAALGVQSRKNKERDFQQGNPMHFIVGGLVGTLVFIGVVWALVQYLIHTA